MLDQITLDVPYLQLLLWIIGSLFVMAVIRWVLLSRANRRMRLAGPKLEKQIAAQQIELTSVLHDAASWRAKMQRQFDALRIELAARHQQSEQGNEHVQQQLNDAQQQAWETALARIAELETKLAAKAAAPATAAPSPLPASPAAPAKLPPPPLPSLPALPSMETLCVQSLESELAAAKAELATCKQHNTALQRALQLARRRPSAMRKTTARGAARSA